MLDDGEDGRLTPRASGPALCTPDALQSLLERMSRLERQSSAVLGGVVLNELTKTAHTSVDQQPAANTKCGWRYAEGAGSRLADAVGWNCGAWRGSRKTEVYHQREVTASSRAVQSCTTGAGATSMPM